MIKFQIKISVILFFCVILQSLTIGSVQTLPKNIWKFSINAESYSPTKIAGETINSDGSGQGDFRFISLGDYTAKYVSSLRPLITAGLVNPETRLVDSGTDTTIYFDLYYGFTDTLSGLVSIPYVKRSLFYSQSYIDTIKSLKAIAKTGAIPGKTESDFIIPPNEAVGEGIGDITLAMKYKYSDELAIGLGYRGGFLKLGKDGSEISQKTDNHEELFTSSGSDRYTLKAYYDQKLKITTIQWTLSYDKFSDRKEYYLDNKFLMKPGDEINLDAYSDIILTKKMTALVGITYRYGFIDMKYAQSNSWDAIEHSEVSTLQGEIGGVYRPTKFSELSLSLKVPFSNKASSGSYGFPGRIEPPYTLKVGTAIYWK